MAHSSGMAGAQAPAAKFGKILSSMADGQDSPKEGLIAASWSADVKDLAAGTCSKASSRSPERHGQCSRDDSDGSSDAAALMAASAPAPVMLNAHRMLALSTTLPQCMQRPQWSSFDYHVLEKLYTGYASKVYKAVCKRSNEVVVLKSYQLSAICELYQHQIFREVGLHASLAHENVVSLSAAFQEGDFVIMVQEYAAGGNLLDLLQRYGGRLSEHVTVQMVLEPFLRVLQYLHTRGIIHRDIKPENILFSKGMTLKLADFGLAIDLRRERAVTRAGTLDYMAPEVLNCPYKNRPEENKEKTHLHYSGTVDSWAVGVLAYELLVGCPPFYDSTRDRAKVEARIRNAVPAFPRSMSEDARSFITAALTKDASQRPSILQLLHHPWINTYRARRSMRQINLSPAASPTLAAHQAPALSTDSSGLAAGASAISSAATSASPLLAKQAAAAAAAPAASCGFSAANSPGCQASPKASAVLGAGAAGSSSSSRLATSPRHKMLKFADEACCDTPVAAPSLSSPKGLSTPTQKPKRSAHHRQASRDDGCESEVLPMLSAKSSPLMVADMREVQLCAAAYGAGSSSGSVQAGHKQRKPWLGLKIFAADK